MTNLTYLQELERESRQLAIDAGDHDLLGGPYLFGILAIRLCYVERFKIVEGFTRPQEQEDGGSIYPGARCPSYAGPISIAQSIADSAGRLINDLDVLLGIREHSREEFDALCDRFDIGVGEQKT